MKDRTSSLSAIRNHLTTLAVAAASVIATALILGLFPWPGNPSGHEALAALSNCPSPTVSNIPCVKYGFKDGPVALNQNLTTIASLPVGAGKYVISAKLYVGNEGDGWTSRPLAAECQLVAGADYDWAKESIAPSIDQQLNTFDLSGTMSLVVGHTFASAGSVQLKCDNPAGGGLSARFIKITAQKVGTLIRVNM